jgi:hypothetical protein
MKVTTFLLILSEFTLRNGQAFVVPTIRTLRRASSPVIVASSDEEVEDDVNPYADPNYPDLEFVNYDDPAYQVDQGEDYFDATSTEEQIEEMREERRRKNDEYQFQTYFRDILKSGEEYKGEWTVYKTSTFLPDTQDDPNGLPRLVKVENPLMVTSRGYKIAVESDSPYPVDKERICHEEVVAVGDPVNEWKDEVDTDTGFGRHTEESNSSPDSSPEKAQIEAEILSNRYWPEQLAPLDMRGDLGIMGCGNSYTICSAIPLDDKKQTPYKEYRAEVGIEANQLRFRIKLDYRTRDYKEYPQLHLKSMTVCREALGVWPRTATKRSTSAQALFGQAGADGGLYDPPLVGSDEQAGQYMLLDLDGRATVLFPYLLDQDPNTFDGNGWVTSLDWTPGPIRFQVDRKVQGGAELLVLRTLELSEVASASADEYRPRDGGEDMRQ